VLAKKREETRVLERPVGPHCLVTPCLQGPGDLSIPSLHVQPPLTTWQVVSSRQLVTLILISTYKATHWPVLACPGRSCVTSP
jgi:hypothetical protein